MRRRHPALTSCRHAVTLVLVALWGCLAAAQGLPPRAPVPLPHLGNECQGVPACLAVGGAATTVAADTVARVALACPESHPNAWHWDTEQHGYLHVKVAGRTRGSMTFTVGNTGAQVGTARILMGCSTQPFDVRVAGSQSSRTGAQPRGGPLEGSR